MNKRASNIELLRIVALMGVVIMHFSDKILPLYDSMGVGGGNVIFVLFFRSLASASVDIFLIISGFFMCTSYKRVISKPINLMLQVCVYSELAYLITVFLGLYPLSMRSILSSLIPDSYYSILFVVLYFISPYINKVLSTLSDNDWNIFVTIVIICFSFLSLVTPILLEMTGNIWMGTSGVGAWGSQQGFNIVNFILCYCIGAYIRLGNIPYIFKKMKSVIVIWGLSLSLLFIWAFLLQGTHTGQMRSAWVYDNPLVILFGVASFLLAKNMNIQNGFINVLATLVYPMFLIHCHFMNYLPFDDLWNKPFYYLVGYYLCFVSVMFLLTWCIFFLYNKLFGCILKKLDNCEIKYFAGKKMI